MTSSIAFMVARCLALSSHELTSGSSVELLIPGRNYMYASSMTTLEYKIVTIAYSSNKKEEGTVDGWW